MPLRVIHLGFGGWGRSWHTEVIRKHRGVKVVGTVDATAEARRSIVRDLGVDPKTIYPSLEEALEHVEADAVINTANVNSHVPVGETAVKAGLHYLTEKPFAPSVEDGTRLVDLARHRRRIVMVSQNYRFYPAVQAVRDLLASGTLGKIATVWSDFRRYSNQGDPSRGHYHIEEPLLLDMAVHQFDLMRAVLGCEAREIICRTSNPKWSKFDDAPSATATLRFGRDILVNYRGSWIAHASQTTWAGEWTIECEKGAIVWTSRGHLPESVVVHTNGVNAKPVKLRKMRYTDRLGALNAFVKAVDAKRQPETSGRDNLHTIKLVHAAIEAARTGAIVTLT